MAEHFEGFVVTNGGLNLLAKAIAGKQLKFSRVALGDADSGGAIVAIDAEDDAPNMTELIHWQRDMPIVDTPTVNGGIASLKYMVQNAEVTEGFWLCETGVYALDPDSGDEVLYAYENRGMKGGWLPPTDGSTVWQQEMIIQLLVGNASHITAAADTGSIYVTHSEFQAHIDSATPHPNFTGGGTSTPAIDEKQLAAVSSRLNQVEANLANLYMQLSTENDLGIKTNLLLVEDFKGEMVCDNFARQVTAATAGSRTITLADGEGLLTGSWYTLTDGVNSEFVQVVSIATNGDITNVNLASTVTKTYNLENTMLRRSTMTIAEGKAYGAGTKLSETVEYPGVWRGLAANTTKTYASSFSVSKQRECELEGDYAFTADKKFTLA